MADQAKKPAAEAAAALGGAMQGEIEPFPQDDSVPAEDRQDIADIFGLGEEAGPVPNSSKSGPDGSASPAGATQAADGGGEQAPKPATPPVEPQKEPGQQGEPQAPAEQPPVPEPAPAAPAVAPEQPQPQAPQDTASLQALTAQVQALVAQNAQLQQQIAQQGAGLQAPQTGQGDQQQDATLTQHPLMDYRLAMPDDVASAIFSDDPNQARLGLTHVVNSMARVVHERVIRHADELVNQRLMGFGQQQQLSQQQEQMRQQYFTEHPQHSDPGIRLIVAQEAQAMWGQNPTLAWDENSRRALGARVTARLGMVQQPAGQGGVSPQAQAGQPAPKPAAQMGASRRPAANTEDTTGNFIQDVLTA